MRRSFVPFMLAALALAGCGEVARLPEQAVVGPNPEIAPPRETVIPTVDIAPAKGWPEGMKPRSAPGTQVAAFARDLVHPRWLYVLPNGDVLVAETNAPPKPEDAKGLRGAAMKQVMKKAGAAVPSQNRITLLRDADGDGVAETRDAFLEGLNSPFGMALVGRDFYVANTDSIVRFHYEPGALHAAGPGMKVIDLPGGPINHHWTKNLIASPDGTRLYVTVGSNSNAAENGIDQERGRASIWEVDLATGEHRVFASGLRNANGLVFEPETGELWTVVNERDELGSDLVPDFLTSVKDGGFYGWPYSYYGRHVDERVKPQRPDLVAKALVPDYALGPHVAALGLAVTRGGMYIGEHGSWNRRPLSGYKVVFVPFEDGKPSGDPHTVLDGFVSPEGEAYGRPVGVAFDHRGGLLVADDVGNIIWRVSAAPQVTSR